MKRRIVRGCLTIIGIAICVFLALFVLGDILSSPKRLKGTDFYIGSTTDFIEATTILYKIDRGVFMGLMEGRIADVYWDNKFILVTRLRNRDDSIDYHIVKMLPPVEKGVTWEKFGPFQKEEFENQKRLLGIDEAKMRHKKLYK